ncbi:MAG: hypothetical protein ACRD0K_20730 [Egibacteraceae bacterium]
MAELGTNADGEMVWRCDQCQRIFEVVWVCDADTEGEENLPALSNDDGFWCDDCYLARFGPGVYEPE